MSSQFDIPRCAFPLHPTVLYISLDLSCIPDLTGQIYREGDYPIASGGFGDVWRCRWNLPITSSRGSTVINLDNLQVAVKTIRTFHDIDTRFIKRLRREVKIWARLHHEHILPLLGLVRDFGSVPGLVSPWMDNGTLVSFLQLSNALTRYERFRLVSILRSDYPV